MWNTSNRRSSAFKRVPDVDVLNILLMFRKLNGRPIFGNNEASDTASSGDTGS